MCEDNLYCVQLFCYFYFKFHKLLLSVVLLWVFTFFEFLLFLCFIFTLYAHTCAIIPTILTLFSLFARFSYSNGVEAGES